MKKNAALLRLILPAVSLLLMGSAQAAFGQQRWAGEAPIASIEAVRVEVDARDICVLHPGAVVPREHVMPRLMLDEARQTAPTASFIVDYDGFDGSEGEEAQEAFQRAVDIWATHLTSEVPIRVRAVFADTLGENVLGSARPNNLWIVTFDEGPLAGLETIYPDALLDAVGGENAGGDEPDIFAYFSSEAPWYYGTGEPGLREIDFTSVVLHELGHGLGFFGSMAVEGGEGVWPYTADNPDVPVIYDRFTEDGSGTALIDTSVYPNPSAQLADALEGQAGGVFSGGPQARVGNTGSDADAPDARPELYAPPDWQQGSSYSHLDEGTYPAGDVNALMSPQIGFREVIQSPGAIVCGIFADMGWPLGVDCRALLGDLLAFDVEPVDDDAEVNWVIAQGADVERVRLERCNFGREECGEDDYQEIAVLEVGTDCEMGGDGDIFCDFRSENLAPGRYTFRLFLIDAGGQEAPQLEREVFIQPEALTVLGPYPNPARDQTTLEIVLEEEQEQEQVTVELYNVLGQHVERLFDGIVFGEEPVMIDVNGLAAGVYFVRVRGEDFIEMQELVVAR